MEVRPVKNKSTRRMQTSVKANSIRIPEIGSGFRIRMTSIVSGGGASLLKDYEDPICSSLCEVAIRQTNRQTDKRHVKHNLVCGGN